MSAIRRTLQTGVPQTVRANPRQVKNNAGGYVYALDDQSRLERFLVLGTTGGTYYVSESKLTQESMNFVVDLISRNPELVFSVTSSISDAGRAKSNDAAIYVAAAFMSYCDDAHKPMARALFDKVVRTSRHLYMFADYIEMMSGWGSAKRKAVASWYTSKSPEQLAYQGVKYRGGKGNWTHRDLLRTAHPNLAGDKSRVRDFMLDRPIFFNLDQPGDIIDGFLKMQHAKSVGDVLAVLKDHKNLPWETIPTQYLRDARVWKMLFYNGQLEGQNAIRNVRRLNEIDAFNDISFARDFAGKISDPAVIRKGRIHPMAYANTMAAMGLIPSPRYNSWYSVPNAYVTLAGPVADALVDGFYASFATVEKDMDRTMIALDVSRSMGYMVSRMKNISCAQGTALLSMVVARSTPAYMVKGFTSTFVDLKISARSSLAEACNETIKNNFGATDCAVPMIWAKDNRVEIDKFVVMTDNETWGGRIHVDRALNNYRQVMGIGAKLVVVGMNTGGFTVGDPNDKLTLNAVGFDTNLPKVIAEFGK